MSSKSETGLRAGCAALGAAVLGSEVGFWACFATSGAVLGWSVGDVGLKGGVGDEAEEL